MAHPINKHERRELERRAWEMRVIRRRTLDAVATELGVARGTVSRMLDRQDRRLSRAFEDRAYAFKVRHTAKLEAMADDALDQWDRSKRDAETIKVIEGGRFGDSTETTLSGQSGDPRLLDQARQCMGDIRKIWGADKPPEAKGEARSLAQIADEAERARQTYVADAKPQ